MSEKPRTVFDETAILYEAIGRLQRESNVQELKLRAAKARCKELESILLSVNREKTNYLNELVVLKAEHIQKEHTADGQKHESSGLPAPE